MWRKVPETSSMHRKHAPPSGDEVPEAALLDPDDTQHQQTSDADANLHH